MAQGRILKPGKLAGIPRSILDRAAILGAKFKLLFKIFPVFLALLLLLFFTNSTKAYDYDLNGDGAVNGKDAEIVLDNYGSCKNTNVYDLNGDGSVAFSDILQLLRNFGVEPIGDNAKYDFNSDGVVDSADYDLLKPHVGETVTIPACFDFNNDNQTTKDDLMILAKSADRKIPEKYFSAESNFDGVINEFDIIDLLNEYVGNNILVRFKDGVSGGRISEIANQHNMKFLKTAGSFANLYEINRKKLAEIEGSLNLLEEVVYAEKNILYSVESHIYNPLPPDPLFPGQWGLLEMNIRTGWAFTKGAINIKVAVIDDGFDITHVDLFHLAGMPVFNALDGGNNVLPDPQFSVGHGTAVLGIMAAQHNNSGVSGIAPNAKYMRAKVCAHILACSTPAIADAVKWAYENGADIINLSMGAGNQTGIYDEIIRAVFLHDVTVFVASGNENRQGAAFPANHPDVTPVGAMEYTMVRASDSNWGSDFVFAPGGTRITAVGEDGSSSYIGNFGGTSAATAHVSGLAALYLSYVPEAYKTREHVLNFIKMTTRNVGPSGTYGFGFAQATEAGFMGRPVNSYIGCRYVDFDGNGRINALDTQNILLRWGARIGDLLYQPRFDLNSNGIIDINDVQSVFGRYGMRCEF